MKLIQQLDEDDKQTILKLIDKMLTNKKFKEFFQKKRWLYYKKSPVNAGLCIFMLKTKVETCDIANFRVDNRIQTRDNSKQIQFQIYFSRKPAYVSQVAYCIFFSSSYQHVLIS